MQTDTSMNDAAEETLAPWADRVAKWFDDRNLTKGSTPAKQWKKLDEEFKELKAGIEANDIHEIKDGIGDMLVVMRGMAHMVDGDWDKLSQFKADTVAIDEIEETVGILGDLTEASFGIFGMAAIRIIRLELTVLAHQHGLTIEECQEQAWNDIRHRTGMMIDGVFVKDA